jgi:radical SAM protein with 4Fe4S-binding SPASM domain
MPFNDFLRAILPLKKLYKSGSITVVITGGEPLLRQDLASCGRALREHGFPWGIVTNGYGYTPGVHSSLLAAGMGALSLSLDGLEESHNWLRADKKSFERAVRALELIAPSKGLSYDVVTCVNRRNIHELPDLRDFLAAKKTKAWRLFTVAPIGRAAGNKDLALNPEELKRLMDFIAASRGFTRGKTGSAGGETAMDIKFGCEAYTGSYERRVRDSFFFCRAGINIASVLIDGSISACPNISRNFAQGNICHENFLDVWNKRFEVMRDRVWMKTGLCGTCGDYKDCGGGAMHLWTEKRDGIMTCINQSLKLPADDADKEGLCPCGPNKLRSLGTDP